MMPRPGRAVLRAWGRPRCPARVLALALALVLSGTASLGAAPVDYLGDLKILGWMLRPDGSYANWLQTKYLGRSLREPLNVIIVDFYASSPEEATAKLMAETKAAGYEEEYGHSSGYEARVDGILYPQVPNEKRMAFANKDFLVTNNHGRLMGPVPFKGGFLFVGAFSTERPAVYKASLRHLFVSFNRARDDFTAKLDGHGLYRLTGGWELGNVVQGLTETTADHDGFASVLEASR